MPEKWNPTDKTEKKKKKPGPWERYVTWVAKKQIWIAKKRAKLLGVDLAENEEAEE